MPPLMQIALTALVAMTATVVGGVILAQILWYYLTKMPRSKDD